MWRYHCGHEEKTEWMDVYQGEHFRAVSLSLQDSGSMYFLLRMKIPMSMNWYRIRI